MADPSASGTVRCEHCGDAHPLTFTHCPKTGKPVATGRALVGHVFAERYRILGVLGDGGMGVVYLAEHLLIGRKVAVKRLHPELAGDAKAVARFQREARTAAATGHANVVDVLDMGYGEDGAPFLVMEYLKGESLAHVLRREARLPAARAAAIVGQVLAALWAVHRRGIVHRDLKPDNVFITKRGGRSDYVKVLDFGISKVKADDEQLALTRTGVTVGTPFYMSPEHARGVKELDGRADLYAVGVILYECLAGRVPFQGSNYHALLQAILGAVPPHVSEFATDLPGGLAGVVHKAIARERQDRYQDPREMLLALVPFGAVDPGPDDHEPEEIPEESAALLATESLRVTTPIEAKPASPSGKQDSGPRFATPGHEEVMLRDGRVRYMPIPSGPQRANLGAPTPPPPTGPSTGSGSGTGPRSRGATPSPRATPSPMKPPVVVAPPTGPTPAAPSLPLTSPTPPTPSTSPRAAPPRTVRPSAATETMLKASLVIAAQEHITQAHGKPALARIVGSLPLERREALTGLVMPVAWLPLTLYDAFLAAMERELGSGNGQLALRVGVAAAARDLPTMHRALMQGATPIAAIDRIPQLWRLYHQGGEARCEPAGRGAYRVELKDVTPESFLHATAMAGFFQQLVEMAGGKDVRSSLVASRAHGDEKTLIALRFKG